MLESELGLGLGLGLVLRDRLGLPFLLILLVFPLLQLLPLLLPLLQLLPLLLLLPPLLVLLPLLLLWLALLLLLGSLRLLQRGLPLHTPPRTPQHQVTLSPACTFSGLPPPPPFSQLFSYTPCAREENPCIPWSFIGALRHLVDRGWGLAGFG